MKTGPLFVYVCVPVRSPAVVQRTAPRYPYWDDAFEGIEAFGVYVYARQDAGRGGFHARMFAPDLGVWEDAATGSAAVAFARVIERFEGVRDPFYETSIFQGVEMSRPSQIKLEVELSNQKIRTVRVGGYVVRTAEGILL